MLASTSNLCNRGWKAAFKLKAALKNIDVHPATRLKLFDVLIKPIICYGSDVWGPLNNLQGSKSTDIFWKRAEKLPIEIFQNKFCKNVLGVNNKATNAAVMGELGRVPMTLYVVKYMLRFAQHIKKEGDRMTLLSAASIEDNALPTNKSWKGSLENILKLFGFAWPADALNDGFITRVFEAMKTNYINYWKRLLGDVNTNTGKLYLYRQIKSCFKFEPYLQHVTKNKMRRSMTAIRISTHKLEIETGRYVYNNGSPISRDQRCCTLCQQIGISTPGDELHALLLCPFFESQRNELIVFIGNLYPNFLSLDNASKMFFMLTCEGDCAKRVSNYIHKVLTFPRPKYGSVGC